MLWFTGLSGAGKSTIANLVEKRLHALGKHTYLLDGDNVRHGLNRDLGFTDADRVENIRRVAEVSKLMVDAGPDRDGVVHLAVPRRAAHGARAVPGGRVRRGASSTRRSAWPKTATSKGLYKKARRGELKNFTGIDSPYEAPEHPEIYIDTTKNTSEQSAEAIVEYLQAGRLARVRRNSGFRHALMRERSKLAGPICEHVSSWPVAAPGLAGVQPGREHRARWPRAVR